MNKHKQINIRPFEETLPGLGERVHIDPSAAVIGDVTLAHYVSIKDRYLAMREPS